MNDFNKQPDIDFKSAKEPILASLPKYLKNPAIYEKIEKAIIDTLKTKCSHSEIMEWADCKTCTENMLKRRTLMKKLGFKSPMQYMAWKKTHQQIRKRFPLVDWNKISIITENS